uniref:B-cell CLL/lymphoma 9 protein n=1 Tax=Geotrypetes seraphini TaxID=260995 RepID=A0A6P8R9F5_GEOSA|nr:B-cell CLL/lymphoma 9 protein [Geotrypetes seraphini]XP_033797250.1 B-cell CLL/lymphoma 9 protein [Geotrypetes seraphini]XP_033797251.1 B-cell CLL/lymphoma 9 protein [Geotrypetes seraphini]XP_033797252.1 B-cell CLL/lymphoma 9 protein [Geotrypetes seraphini]XP_033797253.1 B-cell CLL/lymphoma 9 protein [Geotrypetes seraphini]
MLELQEGRTQFSKRERSKKEIESINKIPTYKVLGPQPKSPSPPKSQPSPSASLNSNSATPSMHSSNPKVRNSPSANTQSSPKSKQEVMVRPPTVMSPSSNPQLDSKFSSQGKQGSTTNQSQLSPCEPKSSNHTPKTLPSTAGSMGLKNGAGNVTKGKSKRERSISVDSFDQRDVGTPSTDSEIKDCTSTETVLSQDSSVTPSNASVTRSSTPSHGSTLMPDTAAAQKATSKVVYVFSTEMANKAAEAVIKGQAESIVLFHIQSTSNSKAEATSPPVNVQLSAIRNEPKPQSSIPQEQIHSQTTTVQSNPAATSKAIASCCPISQDSAEVESKVGTAYSPASSTPLTMEASLQSVSPNNQAASPLPQDSTLPGDPKVELKGSSTSQQTSSRDALSLGDSVGGLSQEQLEHRERSLQTLRDIQRMLFPDEKEFALKENTSQNEGSQQNSVLLDGPQKKSEGPVQAMMAQSQSVSKGPGPQTEGGVSFGPPGQREMPFSPEDMVPPPMNPQPGPNGQDHLDHMTPEQVAWLKLQQEFYEEKRRKQEQTVQTVVQQRSLQDMMMHQHGPRGMGRGPPPPYQMNSGEGWGPGGPASFSDGMNIPHSLPSKGMAPHPNVTGSQVSRLPTFVGMMNPDMEVHSIPSTVCRSGLSGVSWPEEIPKIPDGRSFPSGQGIFSGPGRGERFSNSRGLPEEIFQQMSEKQLGMGMEGNRTGVEINRPAMPQRHMEPGGVIFPRMPGDGPLSPSRAEFHKGMPPQLVPSREVEFGLSPRNMNMKVDMNLNISMNSSSQLMSQKLREAGVGPEEIMKIRSGTSEMLTPQQKMILSSYFAEHPQQEYGMSSRPCIPMSQSPGGALRHSREQIGPDQRTNTRLSHMPPLPLNSASNPNNLSAMPPVQRSLGRKPLDNVSAATSQVNSPSVNPLKSPTMRQVQSPMLGSPSGNLKSPQTPSQLAGILTAPTAASSIKSPPVLGSAAASPVHLKSPSLPVPSPGWTSSPKPPMQSPGIPPSSLKPSLGMTSPAMMGNADPGGPLTPTSSQPTSINLQGSLPSSNNYTVPAEPTLSQNPLSIMMSRMSKFAMPSSTPLYHDAIKTVASSDDDSPPARSPNLSSMNNMPGMAMNSQNPPRLPGPHPVAPMPTLSPMGMTQTLSHTNQMPSPNTIGPSLPSHGAPIGSGMLPHNPMMIHGSQEPSSVVPQGRMAFSQGFPPVSSPPQQIPFPHSGPSGGHGHFPTGIGFPDGPLSHPNNLPQSSTDPVLCKPGGPVGPDSYIMGNSMPSVFTDPDLQEVIRPGASGIPEFDLSRIIPSEKPSQTLQYFPRGEVQGRKQPPGPGPGFSHVPGMMTEQNTRIGLPIPGMGGPGPVVTSDMPIAAPSMPGHNPMRLPTFMQQGLIGPHHRMMSTAQAGIPSQPAMMGNPATVSMMAGKERIPAGLYNHPGPMGSPNMLMSMQGMMGPQQNLMILPQMRPRGMAVDVGMGGFSQGPGNPGNMF